MTLRSIDRRGALGALAGGAALWGAGRALGSPGEPLDGRRLMADVRAYDALGEHRTATPVDHATSRWLQGRLKDAGLTTSLQAFAAPLFTPGRCEVAIGARTVPVFPGWPVKATPAGGLRARLAPADASELTGRIAVFRPAKGQGGAWDAEGVGEVALAAIKRGAVGVLVITGGPTGDVVALNALPKVFDWPVPVAIVGGRHGEALLRAATDGAEASFTLTGTYDPDAQATNVVARRPGRGKTLVVSTPKSGWFHCAGERGTGIAIFLGLAASLVRHSDADLLFVSFSGHEQNFHGGEHFVGTLAPKPDQVAGWLHIGANAGMQDLTVKPGLIRPSGSHEPIHRVTATAAILPAAQKVFTGRSGYQPPALLTTATAVGEVQFLFPAGYPVLAGLNGVNPLFHTPEDRAPVVTSPAVIETAARTAYAFVRSL